MRSTRTSPVRALRRIVVVTLLTGATLVAPAVSPPAASADARGCEGAFTGPTSCTFELEPTDIGFHIEVVAEPGTDVAFVRARCCLLQDPTTGEPFVFPTTGETQAFWEVGCGAGGAPGGYCSHDGRRPPAALSPTVFDTTVTCTLAGTGGTAPLAGTWKCVPLTAAP